MYIYIWLYGCTLYFVEVFVLISYVGGQGELYCSHETLYLSILNPTVYTQIAGM